MKFSTMLAGLALGCLSTAALAQEVPPDVLQKFLQGSSKEILTDANVIAAIKAANLEHDSWTQSKIDAVDKQWMQEAKSGTGPLVSSIVDNDVSELLRKLQSANADLFKEIFVMDNKGLNVAAAQATSDYWQGDEAKWQKTFLQGPDAVFADKIKFDESSGAKQSQVNLSIKDPQTGKVIGAVTFGVNINLIK